MKFKNNVLLTTILFLFFAASADEGMWLPSFLSEINIGRMQKLGSELTANDIYNINSSSLKDAIISLDKGSCTGELVSPDGLFFTNYHCGYSDIQNHSSVDNNILRDGFWAKTKEDELSNPGKTVTFLIRVEDVTDTINSILTTGMIEEVRLDSIEAISSRLEAAAVEGTNYEASVKDLFESNRYYLFVTETYLDVRLVGVPPHFVGKFGGDTDNWMWPRHTGDFAIFRIYTGTDGKPAGYSKDNIPLKPRHFLPISIRGYKKGDFALVMGYPGSTNRYLTSDGVKYIMDEVNNTRINIRKKKLEIISDYMNSSEKATIQYATKYARSSNYYKHSIGQNRGLAHLKIIDKKKKIEEQFAGWVNADEMRKLKYGNVLQLISEAYLNGEDDKAYQYLSEALLRGPDIFQFASRFLELRQSSIFGFNKESFIKRADLVSNKMKDYFTDYNASTDQKLVAELTKIYVKQVNPKYYPEFVKTILSKYKGDYDKWADDIFKKSFLGSEEKVKNFFKAPKKNILISDPAINISKQIYDVLKIIKKDNKSDLNKLENGYRLYMSGLMEMNQGVEFYPNANSTMRLTWGEVGDYYPAEAIHYDYFTTLKGYIEKDIPGDREFDVWPRLKELYYSNDFGDYADSDGTIHTCFISNNDITGGNSGSPVMNSKGELVGIAFDGNWEAMSSDIVFEPDLQKCINVDIRFVLWMIDKFAGATHLIDEMTLIK